MFLQFKFHAFSVGDVAGDPHRANDVSLVITQWEFGGENPGLAPVRPGLLFFLLNDRLAGADNLLFVGEGLLACSSPNISNQFFGRLGRGRSPEAIGKRALMRTKRLWRSLK